MSPSLLFRQGYFFTLVFASALTGTACIPLIMPELFGLPALSAAGILVAGIVAALGLLLRWPTARSVTAVYLLAVLVLSLWFVFTHDSVIVVGWSVLGSVCAIMLAILVRSRAIRTYEIGR